MSRSVQLAILAFVFTAAGPLDGSAETRPVLRRFALIAGANDGGYDRVRLRYATSDAEAFSRVLEELGGVVPGDRVLLLEPSRSALAAALVDLASRIGGARAGADRLELVLYYSGHSDDEGLLLQGERFSYGELRAALAAIPADVRLAVLDSCSSGALTRRKGGVRRPPFLVDTSAVVRGHAFLTSSSEHEAAQESDRIRASYFTHYLVSGLRGAADITPDGRVTLNEAYQFAFAETLRQTEKTQAGPQHAAYDIQLQGTGDLVMTDLRATSASLRLASELAGRFYVHDADEHLVAELYKPVGRPVQLGLAPGDYMIRLDRRDALYEAQVRLTEGAAVSIGPAELQIVSRELTAMRGGGTPLDEAAGDGTVGIGDPVRSVDGSRTAATTGGPVFIPLSLSLLPEMGTAPPTAVKGLSLNLIWGRSAGIEGVEIGLGLNSTTGAVHGVQMAGVLNQVEGDVIGVQLSEVANIAAGEVMGLQATAGFNVAGGGRLWQLSGIFNISKDEARGLQASSGFNSAGGAFVGAQLAALVNHAEGSYHGLQAAAGLNLGGSELHGVQAAIVNVGGDVYGSQVGIVNIARRVDGMQLGLVNLADEVDVPIGLVSFVRQGQLHLDLTTASDEPFAVGVRFGSKHVYTFFSAGVLRRDLPGDPDRWDAEDFYAGMGLGGHVPLGNFFADVDVFGGNPWRTWKEEGSLTLARLRLSLGYRFAPRLAVFVSGAANVLVGVDQDLPDLPRRSVLDARWRTWREGNTVVHLWPGVVLGVRI